MKMRFSLLVGIVAVIFAQICHGATIYKLNNTEAVDTAASWKDGVVPGAGDTATWGSAVTGLNSVPINQALTWDGMGVVGDAVADMVVYGAAGVTFDGGASPDFNILSRSFRWQTPLILSGASSSQLINIEAGALLAFESNVTVTTTGDLNRRGMGAFLIDGGMTSSVSTALILAQGTNIVSGKYGGIYFATNASAGARLYVGRAISGLVGTPVSTLIISNGVHYFGGTDPTGNANLIGASGAAGRLILENGRLDVGYLRVGVNGRLAGYPSELTVNGGTLAVRAGGTAGIFSDTGLALGVTHDDNSASDPNAVVNMTQNGGVIDIPTSCLRLGGSAPNSSGTVTLTLNGGVLRTRYIQIAGAAGNAKTINLNGGTLAFLESGDAFRGAGATATNTVINLQSGGCTIDTGSTRIRLVSRIRATAQSRELKKLGSGELVIAAAETLNAPVVVQAGTLAFEGAGVSNALALRMTSGTALSLQNTTFDTFAPAQLSVSSTALITYQFDVSGTSSASDCLVLPAGTVLGTVLLKPLVIGTANMPLRAEEYTILRYTENAPDLARFVVQNGNPFCSYTCRVDAEAKAVLMRVETANYPDYAWVYSGGGSWEEATKWSHYPTNQAGTAVQFLDVLAAPATVTLQQPKTVGSLAFSSTSGYHLGGAPIALDNGTAPASVWVAAGSNSVACDMTVAQPWLVSGATNAWLSLSGAIQSSTPFSIQSGNVVLQGSTQMTGPVGLDNASLIITASNAFPQGAITVTGGGNSRLRYYGEERVFTNALELKSASLELATRPAVLTHAGNLLFSGSSTYNLIKYGTGEIVLAGTGSSSAARIQLDEGPLRFAAGANYVFGNRSERDTFRCVLADKTRTITIDEGAFVQISGIYSEYSPDFLLQINGQLKMTGAYASAGSAADEVALLRANGWGTDLVRVAGNGYLHTATNAFFSLGVRGGSGAFGVLQVTNTAVAEIGRLCLGVRGDPGGAFGGASRVEVFGGRLTVPNYFNWMGDTAPNRTNYLYLGNGSARVGLLETVPTSISVSATNNYAYLFFNGGTLAPLALTGYDAKASLTNFLSGLTYARVLGGGVYVDSRGLDLAILQPLERVPGITDGGLTKSGSGMLTLKGTCTFTGKTTVEGGTLSIPTAYASTVVEVAAGGRLDLVNGQCTTHVFDTGTFQNASGITFEIAADGACDSVQITGVATMGTGLVLRAVCQGTYEPVLRAGTYTLMNFAGSAPDCSTWSIENPGWGQTTQLVVEDNALKLVIAASANDSIWQAPGSGVWETAANWNVAPASADTTAVLFDHAISAPAVVAVNDASRLLSMTFNHGTSYTVAGSALTFVDGGSITVRSGAHRVLTPVVAAGGLTVAPAVNTELGVGSVSSDQNPVLSGGGVVVAAEPSQFTVPGLTVQAGTTVAFTNPVASFSLPLTVSGEGGRLRLADTQTVTLVSTVSGTGNFTKAGVNIFNAGDALQQTGATIAEAGTVTLTAAPKGRLAIGDATVVYAGAESGSFPGLTVQSSPTLAATVDAQSEIVVTAPITATSGSLIKKGPAALRCVAAGTNVFHAGGGLYGRTSRIDFTEMGSSPLTGFGGLTVVEGALEFGAADQVNVIGGEVVVGAYTTDDAGAAKDATLRIAGGTTVIAGNLSMGNNHGTDISAPTGAVSRVEVYGGATVLLNSLRMGYANKTNNAAIQELTIADGSVVTASDAIFMAMQTGSVSRISVSNKSQLNVMTDAVSLRLGELGGRAELTLDDSVCTCLRQLIVGYGKGTVGILRARNGAHIRTKSIVRGMDSTDHAIYFDGATLEALTNDVELIQNPAKIYLGAGGVTFDLSSVSMCRYGQTMVTDPACSGDDGGLTKIGAGTLVITGGTAGYRGLTRFLEGAVKLDDPNVLTNASVVVGAGARLDLTISSANVYGMQNLTLGVADGQPAKLTLISYFMGDLNAKIAVAQTLTLGRVDVEMVVSGNDFAHFPRTYPLMTYAGAAPDVSGLRYAAPVAGRKYTFAATDGVVSLTISPDTENSAVWTLDGSGTWAQAANWSVAPGAGGVGIAASFDGAITAPITVAVDQAVTLGRCYFNNTNTYTLQGVEPLTFAATNGMTRLTALSGSPVFDLPVDVSTGTLEIMLMSATQRVHFKSECLGEGTIRMLNGGELGFGATNAARTGGVEVRNGLVVLDKGGTPGRGTMQFSLNGLNGNGVRVTGSDATLPGAVRINGSGSFAFNTQDGNLNLQGGLAIQQGTPVKSGAKQLTISKELTSSSSGVALVVRDGIVKIASGAAVVMTNAASESICVGEIENAGDARLVIEPNSSVTLAGLALRASGETVANTAVVVQNGGTVQVTGTPTNSAAFAIRNLGKMPGYYEMNAGTFATAPTGWGTVGDSGDGYLTIHGGVMTLGKFMFNGFNTGSSFSGRGFVTVNGGLFEAQNAWYWGSKAGKARYNRVTLNGGQFMLPATSNMTTLASAYSELALNGGTLVCSGTVNADADAGDYLKGLRRLVTDAAGGTVDVRGNDVTIRQSVQTRYASGTLSKVGCGTLTLAATNSVVDALEVREGVLRAQFRETRLPGVPLLWYRFDQDRALVETANAFSTTALGSLASTTDRKGGTDALTFGGSSALVVGSNSVFENTTNFTVLTWVKMSAIVDSSNQALLSSRPDTTVRCFEMKINSTGELRLLLQAPTSGWWNEIRSASKIPLNQWVHLGVVVTPQGAQMYFDGVAVNMVTYTGSALIPYTFGNGFNFPCDCRLNPVGSTAGLAIGRSTPGVTSGSYLKNAVIDDMLVYDRALTGSEIVTVVNESQRAPQLMLGQSATYDGQGASLKISKLAGLGAAVNGIIELQNGTLDVGLSGSHVAGDAMAVDRLVLGTNVTYACTSDGVTSDTVAVKNQLTLGNQGVIALDVSQVAKLPLQFTTTVMTYPTLTNSEVLATWKVTGLDPSYVCNVVAESGAINIVARSFPATVIILR